MLRLALAVLVLIFIIYCVVDAVRSTTSTVRNLPKWAWVTITIMVPVLGGVAWLLFGRPKPPSGPQRRPQGPDDDPDFLRGI